MENKNATILIIAYILIAIIIIIIIINAIKILKHAIILIETT